MADLRRTRQGSAFAVRRYQGTTFFAAQVIDEQPAHELGHAPTIGLRNVFDALP